MKPITKARRITDQLGELKAQISALQEQEKFYKEQLNTLGFPEIDGALYRATVSHSSVPVVAWKRLAEDLHISSGTIKRYTTLSQRTTIRVTARKTTTFVRVA